MADKPIPTRVQRSPFADQATEIPSAAEAPAAEAPAPSATIDADPDILAARRTSGKAHKPFGAAESKLAYPPRAGFTRRWFNDDPGRIDRAIDRDYTHVLDKKGNPVSLVVGTSARGGGLTAYLMEIPTEFYNADFALKQKALDEVDFAIYGGTFKQEPGDKRYTPKDTVKFSVERGPGRG